MATLAERNYVLPRKCFDSLLVISSFSTFSMKLDKLLFSALASATSLAFTDFSSLNDTVVSFTSRMLNPGHLSDKYRRRLFLF
jgi:hypothetical protein